MLQFGEEKVLEAKKDIENLEAGKTTSSRHSVFHQILASDADESIKNTQRLQGEAFILVGAGTITTSSTLAIITYYVLANPHVEGKLRAQLREVMAGFPDKFPTWTELEKVPYLVACIKEGLR